MADRTKSPKNVPAKTHPPKTAENELKLFKSLINKSNDAIFVTDPDTGRFIDMNDQACACLGYDRPELLKLGVKDIEILLPDDFVWRDHVAVVRRTGSLLLEGRLKRKDGSTFPVETNVSITAIGER